MKAIFSYIGNKSIVIKIIWLYFSLKWSLFEKAFIDYYIMCNKNNILVKISLYDHTYVPILDHMIRFALDETPMTHIHIFILNTTFSIIHNTINQLIKINIYLKYAIYAKLWKSMCDTYIRLLMQIYILSINVDMN